MQPNRSNHSGEGTHRANTTTNWSVTNDYYMGSSSNNASRFSQSSGSSNHRVSTVQIYDSLFCLYIVRFKFW